MSFIFYILFAIFFGGLIAYTNEANGNPYHLTLRGKRIVFIVAIFIGLLLNYFLTHFYIDCDLRTGTHTACHITWL